MDHADHVALLRDGVPGPGVWADLGSGEGAFTLALADLLGPGSTVYSVDKNKSALAVQLQALAQRFPDTLTHQIAGDFARPLALPPLDGIVIANALHFLREKDGPLRAIRGYLKPGGRLLIVEYNVDQGNPWVPYPFSYATWEDLARRAGFVDTRRLAARPSRFLHEIYSALSYRPRST
jgi:SAM-dependent methyltransferase